MAISFTVNKGASGTEQKAQQDADAGGAVSPTRQWIRQVEVTFGDSKSAGLDVSNLRIVFNVKQGDRQTPSHADVRIYNLSKETNKQIQKEYEKITIKAGYRGSQMGLVFTGEIKQKRIGRENPVDTFVDILAIGNGKAYNFAVVNKTLAAGHTFKDQVEAALDPMKKLDVKMGFIDDLGTKKMPRARVLFGMSRDILRTIGFATGAQWSIQNGVFQMLKNGNSLPGEVIVLNSRTGMIGLPVQTIDGIIVRCLLNPNIVPGRKVKIDQSSIQTARFNPAWTGEVNNAMIPSLADDGLYKVLIVEHQADTRGQAFYSDLTCTRADGQGPQPIGLASRGIIVDPVMGQPGTGDTGGNK